ncbi:dihydrodipicolinate synthase family protein [uncultured Nitratireductor sp.]|uniref:dihydrodipicolinate synthase family protein n=1 Tax=uncultured Nitratireductor sp. TaxID=520953 RepID=UPI0025EDA788|nr:dihydrodipicolinate synthase family protein [uncultured Nitratireductor sp.]
MHEIEGVWATILLDVADDGQVDADFIDRQISILAEAGVDGIYSNGTASEFHCQTDAQFELISHRTAICARAAGLRFQIGASHPLPQASLERVRFAASYRPQAIQVILPDWTAIDTATAIRFLQGCAEVSEGVPLVLYNPPHAKTVLSPAQLEYVTAAVPAVVGVKCGGGDGTWYQEMASVLERLSVFIPGHRYASGVIAGAHGSYSNMTCLNPFAAVQWARQVERDPDAAVALEQRIAAFMNEAIAPIISAGFPGFACDKAMAAAGGWARSSPRLLWPYTSVSDGLVAGIVSAVERHIPEFSRKGRSL